MPSMSERPPPLKKSIHKLFQGKRQIFVLDRKVSSQARISQKIIAVLLSRNIASKMPGKVNQVRL